MKFALLEVNLGEGHLFYPILLFSLPLYGRSPNIIMTEILLTGTLSLYSINQSMSHKPRMMYQMNGDKQIFLESLKKDEKYDTANYRCNLYKGGETK